MKRLTAQQISAAGVALIVAVPVLSLLLLALPGVSGGEGIAGHVLNFVLPNTARATLTLLLLVALIAGSIGFVCAYLVAFFDFPLRRLLRWALMLPLAIPTYVAAFSFDDFLSFTGPVQSLLRELGGYQSARDYWFPEFRSLTGAALMFGLILYPYVYLILSAAFHYQGRQSLEAARMMGRRPWRIALALARPALVAGLALVLLEVLNDIGAVEYLGVPTITLTVFNLWLNQSNLAGAAQLALALFIIVMILLVTEQRAQARARYFERASGSDRRAPQRLTGWQAGLALVLVSAPVLLGFGIPLAELLTDVMRYTASLADVFTPRLLTAVQTSVLLAGSAAVLTVVLALIISPAHGRHRSRLSQALSRIATSGYAVPGTVIALGLFIPLVAFDNWLDGLMRDHFGIATGLLLSGSGAILVYAYAVRFLALAEGTTTGALEKISPNLSAAARSLGVSQLHAATRITLPILSPALLMAGALVFIDVFKELSATLLLRPFGLNTLATHIYDFAARDRIEEAAPASLLMIALAVIPVLIAARRMR